MGCLAATDLDHQQYHTVFFLFGSSLGLAPLTTFSHGPWHRHHNPLNALLHLKVQAITTRRGEEGEQAPYHHPTH